jgi:hypothetical protein
MDMISGAEQENVTGWIWLVCFLNALAFEDRPAPHEHDFITTMNGFWCYWFVEI